MRLSSILLSMSVILLTLAMAGCNEGNGEYQAADGIQQGIVAQPAIEPPIGQEVSVNLIYTGQPAGTTEVGFDFRVLWGEYKSTRHEITMASTAPKVTQMDLGAVSANVAPVFPGGQNGHYRVKLHDKAGSLMAEFEIQETGKQVKLRQTDTPGYSQRLVFFDKGRYLTAYRVQERSGSSRGREIGVIFVGDGWEAVDASKRKVVEGKYDFPKVDMVVLPSEWMESNNIDLTYRTLKRGKESPAGVCYS